MLKPFGSLGLAATVMVVFSIQAQSASLTGDRSVDTQAPDSLQRKLCAVSLTPQFGVPTTATDPGRHQRISVPVLR